jgi:putative FmdB family regulatory protein
MPIYEFVCENCGRLEEHLQRLNDPPPAACPECQGKMAKIMSRNSFQLKGGGWYKDLYGSTGKPGRPAAEGSATTDGASKATPGATPAAAAPAAAPAAASAAAPASAPAATAPAAGGSKT